MRGQNGRTNTITNIIGISYDEKTKKTSFENECGFSKKITTKEIASDKLSVKDLLIDGKAIVLVPQLPEEVEDKTYSLKLVNGILQWVEEVVEPVEPTEPTEPTEPVEQTSEENVG